MMANDHQSNTNTNVPIVQQASPIFSIAAELRNRIYDLVLIQPTKPNVDATYRPPPLLSVCRQIRYEALKLYYLSNTFTTYIHSCDVDLATRFQAAIYLSTDLRPQMSFRMRGPPCWKKLMIWCEAVHRGETTWFQANKGAQGISLVISAATRMAATSDRRDWNLIRDDLEGWRPVAGALDAKWLEDEEGEAEG